MSDFYNPWRESLENCISGDNYLRASEYRELIEELDDLSRYRNGQHPDQRKAADELERLTRELEEARKDAERYRWLKETFGDCRHGLPNLEAAWDDDIDDFRSIKFWSIKTPEDVDAAIDAAMSQEK